MFWNDDYVFKGLKFNRVKSIIDDLNSYEIGIFLCYKIIDCDVDFDDDGNEIEKNIM